MPLYEYQCDACGQRFEVIQKFSDAPADTCRVCGKGPVQRLLSSPAIQFKGTGWYITDYSQKGKAPAESSGSAKAPDKESGKTPAQGSTTDAAKPASSESSPAKSETAAK
jgi:putative FmdB family regulatory protein